MYLEFCRAKKVIANGQMLVDIHSPKTWNSKYEDTAAKIVKGYGIKPVFPFSSSSLDEKLSTKERIVTLCEQLSVLETQYIRFSEAKNPFEDFFNPGEFKGKLQYDETTELLLKSAVLRFQKKCEVLSTESDIHVISEFAARQFYADMAHKNRIYGFCRGIASLCDAPLRNFVAESMKTTKKLEYGNFLFLKATSINEEFCELLNDRETLITVW